MVDIFTEVEEELRRDRAAGLWKKYGNYVVGAALALVLAVGGWRFYETNRARERAAQSAAFDAAIVELTRKEGPSEAALAALSAQGQGVYSVLARFRLANERAKTASDSKARADAANVFEALAADAQLPDEWRALARLRAAYLLVDDEPLEAMENRLKPFLDPKSPFRHSAREVIALSAWKNQDLAKAQDAAKAILLDDQAPQGLQQRINLLLIVTQAGKPQEVTPLPAPASGAPANAVPGLAAPGNAQPWQAAPVGKPKP